MITAESLLAAIDRRRVALAAQTGSVEPIPYTQVAAAVGVHSALFSRLKKGTMPTQDNIAKLAAWVGDEAALHCAPCEELAAEAEPDDEAPENVVVSENASEAVAQDIAVAELEPSSNELAPVHAIRAVSGRLSESDDPETQAAINRVRELLAEGAVGVSVMLDLHPDDSARIGEAEKAAAADGWEKPLSEYLPDGFVPRQRIRHTAIVDTPAFSDARLAIAEDGTLTGDVTFEGIYTGDVRYAAEPETIDLDATRTPSPIIWDRLDGDHSGMTVGYIDLFERVDAPEGTSGRPVLDDAAITASLAPLTMPAAYFAQTMPTGPEPLRISQPDAKGYRAIRGLAAPKGVCHRSAMACFTFPADPDPQLKHFHTGTLLRLDDGRDIRVGALTYAGHHLDPALAREGVKIDQTDNYRDDANRVLALVRAWPTRFGLMIAGVIPPDVTEAQVTRALACSPSVELWPRSDGRRTLMGIHLVPRPAWPVMASVGSATIAVTDEPIVLEEADAETLAAEVEGEPDEAVVAELDTVEMLAPVLERMDALQAKLDAIGETVDAVLALTPIDEVDIPE